MLNKPDDMYPFDDVMNNTSGNANMIRSTCVLVVVKKVVRFGLSNNTVITSSPMFYNQWSMWLF